MFNNIDVSALIARSDTLQEISRIEHDAFHTIVEKALAHPKGVDRWPCYERLKRSASKIVGFDAASHKLASCKHYEAMIDLIDQLLPIADENDVSEAYVEPELDTRERPYQVDFAAFLADLERKWRAKGA